MQHEDGLLSSALNRCTECRNHYLVATTHQIVFYCAMYIYFLVVCFVRYYIW